MLELRALTKSFSAVDVVKNVNLSIRDGEFFSLLGPSGCGKTTLLRMLGGFESVSSGAILHNGIRIDTLPPHERQFNMVFQRYALFPHLTVWENIAFGLKMKKLPSSEVRTRVQEGLELVKMESFASRDIETLSGGQQQRVALARALVNRPKVLLLDEPLSALDLKLRRQMQIELLALQRNLKHTFIFVTHDQEEALTMSDRIAVMRDGCVEQVGTAQEIYESPKSLFVAQFIGSINVLVGTIGQMQQGLIEVREQDAGAGRQSIWVRGVFPSNSSQTLVKVLVRPERMELLKSAPLSQKNVLKGIVTQIIYQGASTQLYVQRAEKNSLPLVISQLNTACRVSALWRCGDTVFVTWLPEDCTLVPDGLNLVEGLGGSFG